MKTGTFFCIAASLALAGCMETTGTAETTAPTITSAPADKYGPAPTNVEPKVRAFLTDKLKDPDSMKNFGITTRPKQGAMNYGAFTRGPSGKSFFNDMWYVCAKFNAKNSMGGYAGTEVLPFFFYENQVVVMGEMSRPYAGIGRWDCS